MWTLLTVLAAVTGGLLFLRLKVTGGALLGSIIITALFNILTDWAFFPSEFTLVVKIATGAYIGANIRKADVKELRHIVRPTLFMLLALMAYNIGMGFMLSGLAGVRLSTALFATAPGGIMEMTLIGGEMGAEESVVAAVQICRLIVIVMISPLLLRQLLKRREKGCKAQTLEQAGEGVELGHDDAIVKKEIPKVKKRAINVILTLLVATAGGLLGDVSGVPAGAISFALVATAAFNISTEKGDVPMPLRRGLQMLSGALVGSRISQKDIEIVGGLLIPVLLVMLGYMALNIIMGIFINKRAKVSLPTALFGTAAGGMAEMTLVAGEMGGDTAKVATMQFARNVCVVSVYPLVINAVLHWIA